MEDRLIVTASPHIRDTSTTRGLMGNVVIALLPAVLAAAAVVFLLSARGLPARDAVTADFGGIFRFDGQLTLTAAVLGGFLLLAAAALRLVSGGMAGLELILSVFLACSGAALLYALIAQRRSGAFAPTALLVPVCFLSLIHI